MDPIHVTEDVTEIRELLARLERLLDAERAEVERAAKDRSAVTAKRDALAEEQARLEQEVAGALEEGDDERARLPLSKLLARERLLRDVELRLRGAVRRHEALAGTVAEHERVLSAVRDRFAALSLVHPSEVELELLRRKRKREPAEAATEVKADA